MSKDLYVKHISIEATEEDVRKLFAVCGKVTYVHMVKDAKTGQFLGCAYVKMSSEAEAKDALVSLDGARFINRMIAVVPALPQRPAAGKGGSAARAKATAAEAPAAPREQRPGPPRSRTAPGGRTPSQASGGTPRTAAGPGQEARPFSGTKTGGKARWRSRQIARKKISSAKQRGEPSAPPFCFICCRACVRASR